MAKDANSEAAQAARNSGPGERLESWGEIAAYLNCEVRTAQRWEREGRLPVHRLLLQKQGRVYAYKSELDDWRRKRDPRLESNRGSEPIEDNAGKPATLARAVAQGSAGAGCWPWDYWWRRSSAHTSPGSTIIRLA